MPHFSIDDVKETLTADVNRFLVHIENCSMSLLDAPQLVPEPIGDAEGRPYFELIGDDSHNLDGTTGLVGAQSIAGTARLLEDLAGQGQAACVQIAELAARARMIASICAEGAEAMREMLQLELVHDSERALARADLFRTRSMDAVKKDSQPAQGLPDAVLARNGTVPPLAASLRPSKLPSIGPVGRDEASIPEIPSDEFELVDDGGWETPEGASPSQPSANGTTGDVVTAHPGATPEEVAEEFKLSAPPEVAEGEKKDAPPVFEEEMLAGDDEFSFGGQDAAPAREELLDIFHQEARETLVALQGHLQTLNSNPDNLVAARHVERIYHTLKGAAATVGVSEVAELAAELQHRMEQVLDGGVPITHEFLIELVEDTNRLLAASGLVPIDLTPASPPKNKKKAAAEEIDTKQARSAFMKELGETNKRLEAARAELQTAADERLPELLNTIGRAFHTLKGTAVLVGEDRISVEAARLQTMIESNPSRQEVEAELAAWRETTQGTVSTQAVRSAPLEMKREQVVVPDEPELIEAFRQESVDVLENLDKAIVSLEDTDHPKETLEVLFRLFHTLKGVVNTMGLSPTGAVLHRVEDFLEELRDAPILPPLHGVTTFLLRVQADVRRNMKEAESGYVKVSLPEVEAQIRNVLRSGRTPGATQEHSRSVEISEVSGAPLVSSGPSAEAAAAKGESAGSVGSVDSAGSAPGDAPFLAEGGDRGFIRVATDRLDMLMNLAGELVVSRSLLSSRVTVLRMLQTELGRGRRRLVEAVESFREDHEYKNLDGAARFAMLANHPAPPDAMIDRKTWGAFSDLELDRYEDIHVLSRTLGEVSSDFNEVYSQLSRELGSFVEDSEAFGSLVSGIQTEVTRARMVPVQLLFTRVRLPIRDAAERESKIVRVETRGENVTVDKTIADALLPPMLHLVRNAVLHGFESASERRSMGKEPTGMLTLEARQEAGQIVIEVTDDGKGLDLEALHSRGVAMGLISEDTALDDPAVKDLIFARGLSTRATAGAVGGRGVGCDVVRRVVERLNGNLRVETRPGRGTTFVITLPTSLAITRALLVKEGDQTYAVPLYFAERILDDDAEVVESAGVRRVHVDDAFIGLQRLGRLFDPTDTPRTKGPILLLRVGDQRVAIQVDSVTRQEEIVVKSMGEILSGHQLFSGVSVLGTGELVLILDVPSLVDSKRAAEKKRTPAAAARVLARRRPKVEQVAKAGPRVLVVDDSLSVRKVAEVTLRGLGAQVFTAVDGVEALARLREHTVDIVFTDLEMPRMHGYDLIRELRFLPAYSSLPIVVISSRAGAKHQQQARSLGANDYLTKPFNAQVLEASLRRWVPGYAPSSDDARRAPRSEEAPRR